MGIGVQGQPSPSPNINRFVMGITQTMWNHPQRCSSSWGKRHLIEMEGPSVESRVAFILSAGPA